MSLHLRPTPLYHMRALVRLAVACPALPPQSCHSRRRKVCQVHVARSVRAASGQATMTGKLGVSCYCLSMSWFKLFVFWLMGTCPPSQGEVHHRECSSGQRPRSPYHLPPLRAEVKVSIGSLGRDWGFMCGRRSRPMPAPSRQCTHGGRGTWPRRRRESAGL